jgi:hypothetical protein
MENPGEVPQKEPLNTLKAVVDGYNIEFLNLKRVTERQIVNDVVLMLQRLESPTFMKDSKGDFMLRNNQSVHLIHLTP